MKQSNNTEVVLEHSEKWAGMKWDVWIGWNPWLSVGVHIDHRDPSITFHLPGFIVTVGRVGMFAGWSLRRRSSPIVEVRHAR